MKLKKVRILVQSVQDTKTEWSKALRGEVRSIQKPGIIIFPSLEAVAKVLSPARLELLGTIIKEKPESIYALAKAVDRDFKNVHSDVKVLVDVGLLELKATGSRDALKPIAKYSGFEVDLAA